MMVPSIRDMGFVAVGTFVGGTALLVWAAWYEIKMELRLLWGWLRG